MSRTRADAIRQAESGQAPVGLAAERDLVWYQRGKRAIDVAIAGPLLLLLAPLCVVLGVLIKGDTPGPVLFTQRRVGARGAEFVIYKFRTMHADTPAYALKPSSADDRRVTRVGQWLRRWSMDEVPQLLNVLRGEMSLVGPHPEMAFIVAQYDDRQRQRLNVPPGITGLWQISEVRALQIHDHIEYDLSYIANRSLALDLTILFHTFVSVVRGNGAW
jgi:lipopolysaccharide/colanic/teichoic acid biosynthesis glycosyltransferase